MVRTDKAKRILKRKIDTRWRNIMSSYTEYAESLNLDPDVLDKKEG